MDTRTTHASRTMEHDSAGRGHRDCGHPGSPHRHGTRVAYVADGCRCILCRVANRAAERHRTAALRIGCWQPYVDAAPARAHLTLLREHGVGLDQIAKISNTPKSTIRRLLHEPPESPGRIRTETADRLLAIRLSPDHVAPRSQVDATETCSRIHTLVGAGHPIPELAHALGKTSVSLRRTLNRRLVTAQTAASVSRLYDRMQSEHLETNRASRRPTNGTSACTRPTG